MKVANKLDYLDTFTKEDFAEVFDELIISAQTLHSFINSSAEFQNLKFTTEELVEIIVKNPFLIVGMVLLASLRKLEWGWQEFANGEGRRFLGMISDVHHSLLKNDFQKKGALFMSKEEMVEALSSKWLELNVEHTDEQYTSAKSYFRTIAGL